MCKQTRGQNSESLTAFDFQRAVLLVQRVSAQVHHAGGCRGDPKTKTTKACLKQTETWKIKNEIQQNLWQMKLGENLYDFMSGTKLSIYFLP